jgi:hypothetical protein
VVGVRVVHRVRPLPRQGAARALSGWLLVGISW